MVKDYDTQTSPGDRALISNLPAGNPAPNFHFRFCFLETRLLPIPNGGITWETDFKFWMHKVYLVMFSGITAMR